MTSEVRTIIATLFAFYMITNFSVVLAFTVMFRELINAVKDNRK